jgi:MFS family permease
MQLRPERQRAARRVAGVPRDLGPDQREVEFGEIGAGFGRDVYQAGRSGVMIAGMDAGTPTWKGRIARFYPRRRMAHVVLTVSGAYIAAMLALVLAMYLELVPTDPIDAVEEPIRAFIYHSLRALALPMGIGFLVSWICFGAAALVLVGVRRTPVLRTHRAAVAK